MKTKSNLFALLIALILMGLIPLLSSCGGKASESGSASLETEPAEPLSEARDTETTATLKIESSPSMIPAAPLPPGKKVLILHDASGPYGYIGSEYMILLTNLLGHFNADVTAKPVGSYESGEMGKYDVSFYIGSTYEERNYLSAIPSQLDAYNNFLDDAGTGEYKLAWINYNLWRLNWTHNAIFGAGSFEEKFGFSYKGIENNQYNRVKYKDIELYKGVVIHPNPGANLDGYYPEGTGAYACAQELNVVTITNPELVKVYATTYSTINTTTLPTPYALKAGNLWFIADIPFTYFSEEDRYLAFADLLHEILESGVPDQTPTKAIVRFEDVSPAINHRELDSAAALLANQGIPFAVATVPLYLDPLDLNPADGGKNEIKLPGSKVGRVLKKYYKKGYANIIHHGTTHQWGSTANPYNAVTGDDFEFFRVTINSDNSLNFEGAVENDSGEWALDRIAKGQKLLSDAGLKPFAWEAPHYMASETDYLAIKTQYPVHYGRMLYTSPIDSSRYVGQFFPYVIEKDYYGYRQVPESIANIEPAPFEGYRPLFPEDLIRHAQKLKVVRDGIASFFYHPYLGTEYLDEVVKGLKAEGYEFVAPCSLALECPGG